MNRTTDLNLLSSIIELATEARTFAENGGDEQHWFQLCVDSDDLAIAESMLARLIDSVDIERCNKT